MRGSQVHATLRGARTLRSALSGEGDLEAKEADGNTALHWAAAFGYVDVIAALLERGAETDATNGWGRIPLLMAAGAGHAEATLAFVDAGADPRAKDRYGNTPLRWAKSRRESEAVELLAPVTNE